MSQNQSSSRFYFQNPTNSPIKIDLCQRPSTTNTIGLGDLYGGGVLCYIFPDGVTGLVCALSDLPSNVWSTSSGETTALSFLVGDGKANSDIIFSYFSAGSYAVADCLGITLAGYSDWYVPTVNGYIAIKTNANTLAPLANTSYWTSTDQIFAPTMAYTWSVPSNNYAPQLRTVSAPVRPMRTVTLPNTYKEVLDGTDITNSGISYWEFSQYCKIYKPKIDGISIQADSLEQIQQKIMLTQKDINGSSTQTPINPKYSIYQNIYQIDAIPFGDFNISETNKFEYTILPNESITIDFVSGISEADLQAKELNASDSTIKDNINNTLNNGFLSSNNGSSIGNPLVADSNSLSSGLVSNNISDKLKTNNNLGVDSLGINNYYKPIGISLLLLLLLYLATKTNQQ